MSFVATCFPQPFGSRFFLLLALAMPCPWHHDCRADGVPHHTRRTREGSEEQQHSHQLGHHRDRAKPVGCRLDRLGKPSRDGTAIRDMHLLRVTGLLRSCCCLQSPHPCLRVDGHGGRKSTSPECLAGSPAVAACSPTPYYPSHVWLDVLMESRRNNLPRVSCCAIVDSPQNTKGSNVVVMCRNVQI